MGRKKFTKLLFLSIFFLFIFSIKIVFSYPCVKFQFLEKDTNIPITNVEWRVWACTNSACTTVDSNYWYQSGNSGSNNYAYIKFKPTLPSSGFYLVDLFPYNRRGELRKWNPYWSSRTDPNACDTFSGWDNSPDANIKFSKAPNCKADFTTQIASCAEAGLPLTILTDTQLATTTQSAFITNNYYFPPEFSDWLNVTTKLTVDIKQQGEQDSVIDYPQQNSQKIYASTSSPFSFLWQTSKNTEPGDYTITMTSTVPDEKCDQTNMVPVKVVKNVHIAQSFDTCVATVDNFQTSASGFALNSPITFTGKKLNSYQDWTSSGSNCNTKGTLNSETFFDTTYTLKIINTSNSQVINTQSGVLPKNTVSGTKTDFTLSWTPLNAGSFNAELTTTSTGDVSVCNGNGITTSQTIPIVLGRDNDGDKYYDQDFRSNRPHDSMRE